MKPPMSRQEAADALREQAATCRRLAARTRTISGSAALRAVASLIDLDARRIDPMSAPR